LVEDEHAVGGLGAGGEHEPFVLLKHLVHRHSPRDGTTF
jgi:hypothetical protein